MNRLLVAAIALSCVAISGCSTPLKVKTTDAKGTVREIAVVDASGAPVEVGYSQRNVVEKIVPALDADIRRVLADKVQTGDFKTAYTVVDDAQLKGYSKAGLTHQSAIPLADAS